MRWLDLFRNQTSVTLIHADSSYYEFENLTRFTG
jgi:hypothetical protein